MQQGMTAGRSLGFDDEWRHPRSRVFFEPPTHRGGEKVRGAAKASAAWVDGERWLTKTANVYEQAEIHGTMYEIA